MSSFQLLSSQLDELKKQYPNNKYEFPVFNPKASDISTTPAGCTINASSTSNVGKGKVDIAPTMKLISDKLYTPTACKMEAGILKSTPQFKSAPLYYSIVENTPLDTSKNLFKCYTYSGKISPPIQNPDPAKYSVNVMEQTPLWSAFPNTSPNNKPTNYATINVNGDLVIKNTNIPTSTIVVKAIKPITSLNSNYRDCYYKNYTQEIDDWVKKTKGGNPVSHWNLVGSKKGYNPFCNVNLILFEENKKINLVLKVKGSETEINYVIFSKPIPKDAVGNYNWYLEQKAGTPNFIDKNGNGKINLQSSIISNDCKFKLKISKEGNLVLVYCKEICITDKTPKGDIRQYSQEKDARFLNLVDVPKEFNHIYYKTIDNQMKEVPTNSKILSYDNHLYPNTPVFTSYDGYVPRDLTKSQRISVSDCNEKCKNDPNCDYYYHYTQKNNNSYCQTGKNTSKNIVPSGVFNSAEQYSILPDKSTLNIRNKKVDLPIQSMSRDPVIPMKYTNDYAAYSSYPISKTGIESFSNITEGLSEPKTANFLYNNSIPMTIDSNGNICKNGKCSKEFNSCDIISDGNANCKVTIPPNSATINGPTGEVNIYIKNNQVTVIPPQSSQQPLTATYTKNNIKHKVYKNGKQCKINEPYESCPKHYMNCDIKLDNSATCKNYRKEYSIKNNTLSEKNVNTAIYFKGSGPNNKRYVYNDGTECDNNSCSKPYMSCVINPNNTGVCKNETIINNRKTETLYDIKDNQMTSKTKNVPIPTQTTPARTATFTPFGTNSERSVKTQGSNINNMLNPKKENFNPSICKSDTKGGCKQYISNNIQSLNRKHSVVSNNSSKINSNYVELGNNIDEYNVSRAELNRNAKYEFNPSAGINQSSSNILDVANDDINEMILQQNNMYILGTVTSASLLIAAIMLSGSD